MLGGRTGLVATLALLLGSAAQGASSRPSSECVLLFARLSDDVKQPLLTVEQSQLIETWFNDSGLSSSDAAERAFDLVLEARIAKLPPAEAEEVRRIARDRVKVRGFPSVKGFYNFYTSRVSVILSKKFHHTALEYFIRVHELEHAIQATARKSRLAEKGFVRDFIEGMLDFENEKFGLESGAMLAEWQYMRVLPPSLREDFVRQVQAERSISSIDKKLVEKAFLGNTESSEEYLRSQHESGRYSRKALAKDARAQKLTGAVLALTGTGLAAYLATVHVCLVRAEKEDFTTSNDAFAKMCRALDTKVAEAAHERGV